jgi:protein-tyrosine phosphatase
VSPDEFTVLVVCRGNINRSALGAALLQTWAGWYLPAEVATSVRVTSAGLGAPVGAPMGRRALAIAEALGADGKLHRAVQITEPLIRGADLVLVSSGRQRDHVLGLVPGALRSTFTMREAGRILGDLSAWPAPPPASVDELRARVRTVAENRSPAPAPGGDDIIDPQGKDEAAFRLMVEQELPALTRIAGGLFGMPAAEIAAYDAAAQSDSLGLDGGGGGGGAARPSSSGDAVGDGSDARPAAGRRGERGDRPPGRRRA